MRLCLHICCAPCLEATLAGLADEFGDDLEVRGFFYNPNIHPLIEFRRRVKSVQVLNETLGLELDLRDRYGLELFLREVWKNGEPGRCRRCYIERLCATAQHARKNGYDIFSSTLICSTHQDHGDIRQAGEEASMRFGVDFFYRDLRSFSESLPPRPGIYRQQYCGCVFSEEERFRDTSLHRYRGPGDDDQTPDQ